MAEAEGNSVATAEAISIAIWRGCSGNLFPCNCQQYGMNSSYYDIMKFTHQTANTSLHSVYKLYSNLYNMYILVSTSIGSALTHTYSFCISFTFTPMMITETRQQKSFELVSENSLFHLHITHICVPACGGAGRLGGGLLGRGDDCGFAVPVSLPVWWGGGSILGWGAGAGLPGGRCLFVTDAAPRVEDLSLSAWGGGGGLVLGGGGLPTAVLGTLETAGRLGGGGIEVERSWFNRGRRCGRGR